MKIRETNLIEICKVHGIVYNIVIDNHTKPARQSLVPCRCNEIDSSFDAKQEKWECKVKSCSNSLECIFHKKSEPDIQKRRRPILIKFHKNNKKYYGCIHFNWTGDILNEE